MPITDTPATLPWYRSRIIVGGILALVAYALKYFGIVDLLPADQEAIADAITGGGGVLAILWVIYERVTQKAAPRITGS